MTYSIITLKKVTSVTLIICITIIPSLTFYGCEKKVAIDDSQIAYQIPSVVSSIRLPFDDSIIKQLKMELSAKGTNKSQTINYIETIENNFGELDWVNNQYVIYNNSYRCVFVPIVVEDEIATFLLSMPNTESTGYKSIILELASDQKPEDKFFSGSISYYNISGNHIASYHYDNGMYIYSETDSPSKSSTIKSVDLYQDCNFNCVYTCFNELMTSDWIYGTVCAIACVAWETGIGLYVCIVCVGGPALYCLDECCPNLIE